MCSDWLITGWDNFPIMPNWADHRLTKTRQKITITDYARPVGFAFINFTKNHSNLKKINPKVGKNWVLAPDEATVGPTILIFLLSETCERKERRNNTEGRGSGSIVIFRLHLFVQFTLYYNPMGLA